ncbi:MAG: hypothetical protein BWY51_00669 [Parcubacteria group bacterium ADurb.Bin316]|nr:MAG: hypothetical protein BWY51_00669 [Parcubacteria group bacterium ADurb.Bin316]HOZ56202.1 hypothetical protein [bacterium]
MHFINEKYNSFLKRHPMLKLIIVVFLFIVIIAVDFYSSVLDGGITRNNIILLLIFTLFVAFMNWSEEENCDDESEDEDEIGD